MDVCVVVGEVVGAVHTPEIAVAGNIAKNDVELSAINQVNQAHLEWKKKFIS